MGGRSTELPGEPKQPVWTSDKANGSCKSGLGGLLRMGIGKITYVKCWAYLGRDDHIRYATEAVGLLPFVEYANRHKALAPRFTPGEPDVARKVCFAWG